jgi:hypothetical protein
MLLSENAVPVVLAQSTSESCTVTELPEPSNDATV